MARRTLRAALFYESSFEPMLAGCARDPLVSLDGLPPSGELESGTTLAGAFGASLVVVTSGLATILLTAWVAWQFPRLRRYEGEVRHLTAASESPFSRLPHRRFAIRAEQAIILADEAGRSSAR